MINLVKPWLRRAVLACALLPCAVPVLALDPSRSLFQYNLQSWDRQNGLPVDIVSAISQTKDGFIWLGTPKGMVRFDGQEFKVFDESLPATHGREVRSLSAAKHGGIWFAIQKGNFGFFDGAKSSALGDERWAAGGVNSSFIAETSDGAVWTGEDNALGRWVNGKPAETFYDSTFTVPLSFCEGAGGRVWIGTIERGLFFWQNGKFGAFPNEALKKQNLYAVAEDAQGQIWVGTGSGLQCYDAKFQPKAIPAFTDEVKALLVDRQGVLWVATAGGGLARYKDGKFDFLRKSDGLASDTLTSVFEDREGSVWVGSHHGVTEITDVKFPVYTAQDGLPIGASTVSVSASRKGGMWITTTKGLSYLNGQTVTNLSAPEMLPQEWIRRAFEASNGDLYLMDAAKQLVVFSGGQMTTTYTNDEGWPTALAEDAQGVIVGVARHLYRTKGGQLVPYVFNGPDQPDFYWILNLKVARDGGIWVASQHGVFRVKDGGFQEWDAEQGLLGDTVNGILEDTDGTIWLAMVGGIARIKGNQIKNITTTNGLTDDRIFAMVADDRGNFWMDSGAGILRATRDNLNDFADGRTDRIQCAIYDGLESIKFIGHAGQEPVACQTTDGKIWFPAPQGVVMIDPANLHTNTIVPSVLIEQIRVNGAGLPDRQIPALKKGGGQLEFFFSLLSYVAPQKARLRYQLQGLDAGWVDAEGRRSVLYNNLKPGSYVFRVQGCNADGVWNTAGDSFAIELPPAFYQTAWFALICVLLGFAAVGLVIWRLTQQSAIKQRRLKAANDLLELKVRERTSELAEANTALGQEVKVTERAEQALRAEQRLLRTMINALPMSIGCIDKDGRYVFANNLVSASFGIPLAEIEARHYSAVMPAELHAKQKELVEECLGGKVVPFVYEHVQADGRKVIVQGAFAPVSGEDGAILGAVYGAIDITERRRQEEELLSRTAFFEALVDSSPDGILVVNSERKIILQNKKTTDLWQIPGQLVEGQDDDERVRLFMNMAREPDKYLADVNRLYAHPSQTDHCELELRNGATLDRYSSAVIGKDGRYYGRIWMFQDITERKRLELEMERTHQQLMVASRQAGMAEVATGVLHNVGNVLNSVNVSANLVMNSIRNSRAANLAKVAEMLAKHQADLGAFITSDEKGKNLPAYLINLHRHLETERAGIIEELKSLTGNIEHINEIVSSQQANARKFGVIEMVPPVELMESALKMNEASCLRHQIKIIREFEAVPPISVDRHKILQILINLLQNAKRACKQSGRADSHISVRIRKHGHDLLRLEVADTGVGIPPENLTRIFAHGFTTQKDGHGFGLHSGALVAKELHGTLTAHSEGVGKGATFIVELPLHGHSEEPDLSTSDSLAAEVMEAPAV